MQKKRIYRVFAVILLFLYMYPIFLRYIPIPTDRILQIFGLGFFLFSIKRKKVIRNKKMQKVLGYAFLITIISFFALMGADYVSLYFVKYVFDIFFLFFSSFAIISIFQKSNRNFNIVNFLDALIVIGIIQAIISFCFFINPSLFYGYLTILDPETNASFFNKAHSIERRLYGIGNQYFSAVINYGVYLLILCVLPYIKGSKIYKNKIIYWLFVGLISSAGILSGRTFFIAIALSLLFIVVQEWKYIWKIGFKVVKIVCILSVMFFIVSNLFKTFIDTDRLSIISDWALELFINYNETGELTTSSTEAMKNMYKFPDQFETILFGDGEIVTPSGSYYMHTDIGYIRLLFYFGILGTLAIFLIQFKYSRIFSSFYSNKNIKLFSLFLFFWILLLNLKGLVVGDLYFMLFIMCAVLTVPEKQIIHGPNHS